MGFKNKKMKTNDYLLLAATGSYSFLFFEQNAGINFLLYNIVFISILAIKNKDVIRKGKWLWGVALCLISSINVFIHSSTLSIIANVFSLLLVSAFTFNSVTSGIFSFFFSCFSVVSSPVYMIIDLVNRLQNKSQQTESKRTHRILAIVIVIVLSLLFFILYKNSNPLFAENTKWINLDFISFKWICFTIGSFVLLYGLFYHKSIALIEHWENNLKLNNTINENFERIKQYETERFAGLLLFILLNLMLLGLNAGDIQTLYFGVGLPKGITHADFVHSGVGLIILSIIIATSLIMLLYRKEYHGIKGDKTLKAFVYLWIIQNLIMLVSTAYRNQMYIHQFNYTYKRIGVYVWLSLAVIGLIIMFIKIYKERSNWYLIKSNIALWFTVLSLSSCFNWDKIITKYNLTNKPIKDIDFYYLFSLSDTNIPELLSVTKRKDFKYISSKSNYPAERYYTDTYYYGNYSRMISLKVQNYLRNRVNSWKSYDLREDEINNSIYNLK